MTVRMTYRVDDVIDGQPVGALQKRVLILCCLTAILDGFDAQAIGFLAPSIAQSLTLDIRSFGPMFSASLFGLMIGTLVAGPVGDRWGRKPCLLLAMVGFGVLSLLTVFVTTLNELILARLFTGLGLGGALPNLMALASEYMPKRISRLPACLLSAAIPAGGMLAGLVATALLPAYGWHAVFYIGGIAPILMAILLAAALPESIRFLSLDRSNQDSLRAIMAKIWDGARDAGVAFAAPLRQASVAASVGDLFRGGRALVTMLLWLTYFMNLLVLYAVISWMPALLRMTDLPASAGVMAISAFSLGGVIGSIGQGPLMDRYRAAPILVVEFAVFIVLALILANITLTYALVGVIAFAIGVAIQAAQAGLNAFSATFYPTAIRSTGIGWGLGIGRIGSVVGPLLGGIALASGWTPQSIFAAGIVPALCAAAAVWVSSSIGLRRVHDAAPGMSQLNPKAP